MCVFEANGRVGGRVYSLRGLPDFDDLAIDVGGYRFIESDLLPAQLVWKALKLPTACYDWACSAQCEGANCYVVKDAYGNNFGYSWPVETMLGQLEDAGEGQQVFFGKELTAVLPHKATDDAPLAHVAGAVVLKFADGTRVIADKLLLNLPGNAISRLSPESVLFADSSPLTSALLNSVTTFSLTKSYAYYDDAWWATKLGRMQGTFSTSTNSSTNASASAFALAKLSASVSEGDNDVPLEGRYHDGPLKCIIGSDSAGMPIFSGEKVQFGNCSGALEVYYSKQVDYYANLMTSPRQPLTVITRRSANAHVLDDVHAQLMSYHKSALQQKNLDPSLLKPPTVLVIANWVADADFTPGIGSLQPATDRARAAVRKPSSEYNVYIANQDYGYKTGWAAGALTMSEKVLQAHFDLPKPSWLDADWYESNVAARK